MVILVIEPMLAVNHNQSSHGWEGERKDAESFTKRRVCICIESVKFLFSFSFPEKTFCGEQIKFAMEKE